MANDYDVVIIGGTMAGRDAALAASQLRATVALVEPKLNYGFIHHYALGEIGKLAQRMGDAAGFGFSGFTGEVEWLQAMLYAESVAANLEEQHSPAILAAQGIDVIVGSGQFQFSPDLAFAVNHRLLKARTYLLASGSRPGIPEIDGLQATGYCTLSNIWEFLSKSTSGKNSLPKNWVIIGGVPQSIEITQILARLGCNVTLVINHRHILPHIDPEISHLLCCQLEAENVRVFTQTPVTQVMRIENKKWIQAGDKAIETDEILVATHQQPNIESFNLAAVGVKWHQRRLIVNEKLQTTNRRIYACGDVIGGYEFANIANYEAKIALKNALLFSKLKVNYRCIPWGIFSQPMLAQVGLTEAQAKKRYTPDDILVFRQYFKTVAAAQIQNETTGICKLIILRNGEILGASLLGAQAAELINILALAIAEKIKVDKLANLASVHPSFSEIIEQTAQIWHQQKLNNPAFQEFMEGLFQFRRDWNL